MKSIEQNFKFQCNIRTLSCTYNMCDVHAHGFPGLESLAFVIDLLHIMETFFIIYDIIFYFCNASMFYATVFSI